MVGRDVQQDGNVCTEIIHVVELERAELDDVIFVRIFRHLQSQGVADVSCQSSVVACFLEYMVDERGGRGLAVTSCDAYHLRVGISSCKLYLADDVYSLLLYLAYHGSRVRNARAFYYLVGIEYLLFRMLSFLPLYIVVVEHGLVFVLYCRHVRHKHVESLFLCQYCCTCTALCGT